METLEEIEKRIAALQEEIGSDVSSEDEQGSESPASSSSDSEEEEKSSRAEEDEELAPIPALPPQLVPPPGLFLSAAKQPVKLKREEADDNQAPTTAKNGPKAKRVECSACCEVFPDDETYKKHSRSLKHRQNVVLRAGAAYEPANHEPNYCRACEMKFETVELLMAHRKTETHKEAAEKLARASYCSLCKKQFTSPIQLRGHILGKAHNDLVEKKTGVRPVPLTKPVEETKKNARHDSNVKFHQGIEDQRFKRWKQA